MLVSSDPFWPNLPFTAPLVCSVFCTFFLRTGVEDCCHDLPSNAGFNLPLPLPLLFSYLAMHKWILLPLMKALINRRILLTASCRVQKRTKPNLVLVLLVLKGIYVSLTLPTFWKTLFRPYWSKIWGMLLMKTVNSFWFPPFPHFSALRLTCAPKSLSSPDFNDLTENVRYE